MSPAVLNEPQALTPLKAQVRLLILGCLGLAILNIVARSGTMYRIHELFFIRMGPEEEVYLVEAPCHTVLMVIDRIVALSHFAVSQMTSRRVV